MAKTREQLGIENETLRSRVNEMEDALDAIRNGEVDAIMVSGREGEQVYTLSSADTPYRTFIEEMSEGAVTLAKDGTILYCNQRFAKIVEVPYENVIGTSMQHFVTPDDNLKLDSFLARLSHKEHDVIVVTLNNTLYLRLSIYSLPQYLEGDNYILIATDISDLKRKEHELAEIIRKLVNHISVLKDLRIDNISETICVVGGKNKLQTANNKLLKEIDKLNRLIVKLKLKQKKATTV